MQSKMFKLYPLIIVLVALVPLIIAAGTTGKIKGTVVEKNTGNPIAGASVMLIGTTQSAKTGPDGTFVIQDIKPGSYTIKVTLTGYKTVEVKAVSVMADLTTEVNIEMEKESSSNIRVIDVPVGKDIIEQSEVPSISEKKRGEFDVAKIGIISSVNGFSLNSIAEGGCIYYGPAHGGTAIVNGRTFDAMFFKDYGTNPFVDSEDDHLSTFAIDVDDASYIMTRSYLERGYLPPDEAVRTEEFINHFNYGYKPPENGPFSVHIEAAPSRFGKNCQLMKIGIKGREISPENRKPANLVFVIDVSGSMNRENRLELVKKALRVLVDNLKDHDKVGIVVYGSNGRVILEPISIRDRDKILSAIEWLQPGGSTNAEEGLRLGYKMAEQSFEKDKINRIILCSDGVANVGRTSAEDLLKWIKQYAEKGITLTAVGFGMGNYNDILMEKLGDKGNGHYAYVDDFSEAKRIFMENLTGTLQVIARDVKIQVDFDPETVRSYRLLGYENRDVADNKFRDDKEDGGEIGSGHQVTALYEIKLHEKSASSHIGTIYIRHKHPETNEVSEVAYEIKRDDFQKQFDNCSLDFKLAVASAEFAEILGKSYWAKGSRLSNVRELVKEIYNHKDTAEIVELMDLISKAEKLENQLAEK